MEFRRVLFRSAPWPAAAPGKRPNRRPPDIAAPSCGCSRTRPQSAGHPTPDPSAAASPRPPPASASTPPAVRPTAENLRLIPTLNDLLLNRGGPVPHVAPGPVFHVA